MNLPLCLVSLENTAQRAELLGLDLSESSNKQIFDQLTRSLVSTLSAEANGIVLDPIHGLPFFPSSKPGQSPDQKPSQKKDNNQQRHLFLSLHQPAVEVDPLSLPNLQPDWDIEAVANNYAGAFLKLYYHPGENQALKKKQLLAELHDHCHQSGVKLMVELIVFTPAGETFELSSFQEAQYQALEELRDNIDLAVLQYPQESLACATLTTYLDSPWLVSSEGMTYDVFKGVLRDCLEGGAAGFKIGQGLWQELPESRGKDGQYDLDQANNFLKTTGRDRLIELVRISSEYQIKS